MVDTQERSSHHDWTGLEPPQFHDNPVVLQARGEWACFTRPEFNAERVSYPIMTPSAAQGLLSAVFWKPQFRWVIQAIEVLSPVRWTTFRRNESGLPITRDAIKRGFLDVDQTVQQRSTLMLRDVNYRIHAQVWVHPEAREQNPAKWRDQFRRRLERGQTFRTPFMGMREFHADVELPDNTPVITDWTENLGIMLHSIWEDDRGHEFYEWFDAHVNSGRMDVPARGERMDGELS